MLPRLYGPGHSMRSSSKLVAYGDLYRAIEDKARLVLYVGRCCATTPQGHDAAALLAQALDEQGNDQAEHLLLVSFVALNNGTQSDDVRCDCGLDLFLFESFVRFLYLDTDLVARLHYRTDFMKQGNTLTE